MSKNIGYYYCSLGTAISILMNHSLRFSDPLKMNDSEEIIWFFDKLFKYEDYNFKHSAVIQPNSFSHIESAKELILKGQRALYCLCLSREEDLLSQWRGYAKDGTGVAIGIDIETIVNNDEKHISTFDICYKCENDKLTIKEKSSVQENIKKTEKHMKQKTYKRMDGLCYIQVIY